jgi:hypothetical protein
MSCTSCETCAVCGDSDDQRRERILAEVMAVLDSMPSGFSAYDAAVDIRHIYEKLPTVEARVAERHSEDK